MRLPLQLPAAVLVATPGTYLGTASYLGLPSWHPAPYVLLVAYGAAIVGAAFMLAWAAEAAQVDVSAGLALAVLALLAVLPEYAVDFVFSIRAGQTFAEHGQCVPPGGSPDENPCSLALANMTGANRILVGVGWPLVVLVAAAAALRHRRRARESASVIAPGHVRLAPQMSAEVAFLGIATLYSLTLPLKGSLTVWDAAVLMLVFALYARRIAKAPPSHPELLGTAAWLGELADRPRRTTVVALFGTAALVVLAAAEQFADSLVDTGEEFGVDRFLLVQWLAPLASESPELIVACLYAWRLKASNALGTLLSSKVNQWTLLVGTVPIAFAVASTSLHGLPLDTNQRYELLLTAAQSLFAVGLLLDLQLSLRGAAALLVLFTVQLVASLTLPEDPNRIVIIALSAVYLVLAAGALVHRFGRTLQLAKDGTVTPFETLERRADRQAEAATR